MNRPKFFFVVLLFLSALNFTSAFAQSETKQLSAEPTYEVVLQIVVASNNATEKTSVPPSLATVVRKLKALYAFADYRLATTFFQRTANSIEYKSMLNDFNQIQDKNAPVFSEWSLRNLRVFPVSQSQNAVQFDSFRFGARVPVVAQSVKDEGGKSSSVVNYESIGISNSRFSLRENEPTVIGSLATAKSDELIFLVLTVKPAE